MSYEAVKDVQFLQQALSLARHAEANGEVPVGALLVMNDKVIGSGWNQPIQTHDPSAHAEIIAIRQAAKQAANYRLCGSTLYVTLEPCAMCAGALIQARVERLVFGALDPRAGAVQSVFHILQETRLNHRVNWSGGVLADECSAILQQFFKARRKKYHSA